MAIKIYTKTGDKGQTGLFGGRRLDKDDVRIEAYGTIDELNAHIGAVRDGLMGDEQGMVLLTIQQNLFVVGSILASEKDSPHIPELQPQAEKSLEHEIDKMNDRLPTLKHFILPGGDRTVSACHIARCVCRRAERRVVTLMRHDERVPPVVVYLNRLSDYLFVLCREICRLKNVEEVKWLP